MSAKTEIAWTDATWPIVNGCRRVSPGCGSSTGGGCYAERLAATRLSKTAKYSGLAGMTKAGPRWTGQTSLYEPHLGWPLRWRRPRKIFVADMGDLWFDGVPDADVDRVVAVSILAVVKRGHTMQFLTKRAERMRAYFTDPKLPARLDLAVMGIDGWNPAALDVARKGPPFPGFWLGVSVENQERADQRIPDLLATPAAVRFLSVEPMLASVQLGVGDGFFDYGFGRDGNNEPRIHWVIVGGESGPGARPCDVAWIRSVVEQCRAAGVACFVKQLGALPYQEDDGRRITMAARQVGCYERPTGVPFFGGEDAITVRDRKGGDPEEWPGDLRVQQFPEVAR